MATTSTLTGIFAFILITAGLLSVLVSFLLLWLYRRATLRGMARAANPTGDKGVTEKPLTRHTRLPASLLPPLRFQEIAEIDPGSKTRERSPPAQGVCAFISRFQRHSALTCLAAGFTYAVVMTLTWTLLTGEPPTPGRTLMLMTLYSWPSVIAICMVSAMGWKEILSAVSAYLLLFTLTTAVVLLRDPEVSLISMLVLWLIINLPPTVFILFFLQNRIRSVGPLVLAFMFCAVTGAILLVQTADSSDSLLRLIVKVAHPWGLGATTVFVLMNLTGFLLMGIAGWFLLRRIGEAYSGKRFSDRSIMLDSMWLIFAVIQTIGFAFEGAIWILAAPAAFLAYRCVVSIGFRLEKARLRPDSVPLELLLLRVFSLGRRSNRFFDKLSRFWRPVGIINMIAGPDLVTSAVEPHEFLDFAAGKLSRRFVVDKDDLQQRLLQRDRDIDPDGRYRVHEFFCHDDTWRMTMQRLATESHAIVMDLRSFSESNQGCLYELKVLLDTVDLHRIVFVVDNTTNRGYLESSLLALWSELDARSPNNDLTVPSITLFTAENLSRRAFKKLIARLAQHAQRPIAGMADPSPGCPEKS